MTRHWITKFLLLLLQPVCQNLNRKSPYMDKALADWLHLLLYIFCVKMVSMLKGVAKKNKKPLDILFEAIAWEIAKTEFKNGVFYPTPFSKTLDTTNYCRLVHSLSNPKTTACKSSVHNLYLYLWKTCNAVKNVSTTLPRILKGYNTTIETEDR